MDADLKFEVVVIPVADVDRPKEFANWSDWYAAYMVAEQAGSELPT